VALTAFTRAQDRARGFLAGFDVYLPKPVDPNELTALLVSLAARLDKRAAMPVPERPRSVPPPRGEILQTMQGVRVLLVERPELEERAVLASALRETGALVELADSAEAAQSAARRFRPDLLVSASSLPDEDGFALLKQLRTSGSEGGGWIPAVALLSQADEVRRALLAGYQLQVTKPVQPDALVARIVRLVGWSVRR
jgi:CheY-like chemotaxis protein